MVLSKSGGSYRVLTDNGLVDATLRGRLKRGARGQVLVGDRVSLGGQEEGSRTIEETLPRRSLLRRRTPGRARGVRAVAANIDQVVVVGATRQPDWDFHLMDRFTSVAAANDLPLLVVVNKCDLVTDAKVFGAPYVYAGYPVIYTSVPRRQGLEALRVRMRGSTSLLAGPTGVGKSSLLNALVPGLRLRTAAVSAKSQSGRHTTVAVELHAFGPDGFVADMPGLRDIGMWGLDPRAVMAAFPEIAALADACRFDNCRHLREPECAVVDAVSRQVLAATRLESYRRMLEEARSASRHWTNGRDH